MRAEFDEGGARVATSGGHSPHTITGRTVSVSAPALDAGCGGALFSPALMLLCCGGHSAHAIMSVLIVAK